MKTLKRALLLMICVQLAMPMTFAKGKIEHQAEIAADFNTRLNSYINFYNSKFPSTDLNATEIRKQLDIAGFEMARQSWDDDAKTRAEALDGLAGLEAQRGENNSKAKIAEMARPIIRDMLRNSFLDTLKGQKPDPTTFNYYMFELYGRYIDEPQNRAALDFFFDQLGEARFSQADIIMLEKNRNYVSNFSKPFQITMLAGSAGLLILGKWPSANRLFSRVAGRFNGFAKVREAIAARANPNRIPRLNLKLEWPKFKAPKVMTEIQENVTEAAAPIVAKAAKVMAPLLAKSVGQVKKEETVHIEAALKTALERRDGKTPSALELQRHVDEVMNAVRDLHIQDSAVLQYTLVAIRSRIIRTGGQPYPFELKAFELQGLKKQGEQAVAASQHMMANPIAKPVAKEAAAVAATQTKLAVPNVMFATTEQALLAVSKTMKRKAKEVIRDTAHVFGIAFSVGTVYSLIATNYYRMDNTQYDLVPSDVLTHGINAMAILDIACKAEAFNKDVITLAKKVKTQSKDETYKQFVPLVAQMKAYANEFDLIKRSAALYSGDLAHAIDLKDVGIYQDPKTGLITYSKTWEGEEYKNVRVDCPVREGRPFTGVSLAQPSEQLQLSSDRLAWIELSGELNEMSVQAKLTDFQNRILSLKPVVYNEAVAILAKRVNNGESYLREFMLSLDQRMADDTEGTIVSKRIRTRAADVLK